MEKTRRHKLIATVAGVMAACTATFLLSSAGWLDSMDRVALDAKFELFPRETPDPRIAIIAVDESSLAEAGRRFGIYWPWPREFFALALGYLTKAGADVVAFDVLFDTPDADRLNTSGPESDAQLGAALRAHGRSVIAAHISAGSPIIPLELFAKAAHGLGSTNMSEDPDGVIRRIHASSALAGGAQVPSLSMAAFRLLEPVQAAVAPPELLVDWYRKPGEDTPFPYYRFIDVLSAAVRTHDLQSVSDPRFSGKVVFLGASAPGLGDIRIAPVPGRPAVPGVEIHTHALANLLDHRFLAEAAPEKLALASSLLAVLLVASSVWLRFSIALPLALAFIAVGLVADGAAFAAARVFWPSATWLTGAALALTAGWFAKYVLEERRSAELRRAFACYVNPAISEEISRDPESLALGGHRKDITLQFSDVVGFTSLSEKLEPEQLVAVMNDYFDAMTEIILESGGTVDKFIGDAVMAFWGAPKALANHAQSACSAALAQREALTRLNAAWSLKGYPQLGVRFGLNSGTAVVGNIGGRNRFNYTALGDTVNIAARLEPANTRYGSHILISESTWSLVQDRFVCRPVGREVLRGKAQPIAMFELLADRNSKSGIDQMESMAQSYAAFLGAYETEQPPALLARDLLEAHIRKFPDDAVALKMIQKLAV